MNLKFIRQMLLEVLTTRISRIPYSSYVLKSLIIIFTLSIPLLTTHKLFYKVLPIPILLLSLLPLMTFSSATYFIFHIILFVSTILNLILPFSPLSFLIHHLFNEVLYNVILFPRISSLKQSSNASKLQLINHIFVISSFSRLFGTILYVVTPNQLFVISLSCSISLLLIDINYSLEIANKKLKGIMFVWGCCLSALIIVCSIGNDKSTFFFYLIKYSMLAISTGCGGLMTYLIPSQSLNSHENSVPFFESDTTDLSLLINDD